MEQGLKLANSDDDDDDDDDGDDDYNDTFCVGVANKYILLLLLPLL